MMERRHGHQPKDTARVLPFARRGAARSHSSSTPPPGGSPIDDVAKYERAEGEGDDYRHRQITNLAAFLVCTLLVLAGVWIADRMATTQRDQECVLAGCRNCAQIGIMGEATR